MTLNNFLEILHETAELQGFGIITPENPNSEDVGDEKNLELKDRFEEFLLNHGVIYHEIGGKFAGINESSYLVENINYQDLESIAEDFNQFSFIHAVKDPKKVNEPIVYKKGDTKYIFRYYEKQNSSYQVASETSYIMVDHTLSDNYSFFKDQPLKRWSIRFFQDFNPEASKYEHPYEHEEMEEGVKKSTIKKIREVINPRYRRLN